MIFNVDLGRLCNFSCAHCATSSGPNFLKSQLTELDFQRIEKFLMQKSPSKISFVGGEPTLYIDATNRILKNVCSLEQTEVQVVTNGWFADSIEKIENVLGKYEKLDRLAPQETKSSNFVSIDSEEDRIKLFRDTLTEAHSDRMSYVTAEERARTLAEYPPLTKDGQIYQFTGIGRQIDGVIFFMDMDYLGEKVKLLAWVWKSKGISASDSFEFDNQVKNLILSSSVPIISSVEKENIRSIKYHRNLGFKEKWLMLRP